MYFEDEIELGACKGEHDYEWALGAAHFIQTMLNKVSNLTTAEEIVKLQKEDLDYIIAVLEQYKCKGDPECINVTDIINDLAKLKNMDGFVKEKTERFLGPSDAVIASSVDKGLYTEEDKGFRGDRTIYVAKVEDERGNEGYFSGDEDSQSYWLEDTIDLAQHFTSTDSMEAIKSRAEAAGLIFISMVPVRETVTDAPEDDPRFGNYWGISSYEELNEDKKEENVRKNEFIEYCKDKVEDLGTATVLDEDEELIGKVILIDDIRHIVGGRVIDPASINKDDLMLIVIDKEGHIAIETLMMGSLDIVFKMEFTKIDTAFYNDILQYWDDIFEDDLLTESNTKIDPIDAKNIEYAVNDIIGEYYNVYEDGDMDEIPDNVEDIIEDIYDTVVKENHIEPGFSVQTGNANRTRFAGKAHIIAYIIEVLNQDADFEELAQAKGWSLNPLQEDESILEESAGENKYTALKANHEKEFNEFPIKFAFSDVQFNQGLAELGVSEDEVTAVGFGGFIKKSDLDAYKEMDRRHRQEEQDAIKNDKTGAGYIKDMFDTELANHEYGYTYNIADTLESLGLTFNDIESNQNLKQGLSLALDKYNNE